MPKKIVIIGGVAGGATAAARIRRLDENAEIVLFEKGDYVSFANCGLPYYIGDVIKERNALFVATKKSIESKYHVNIHTGTEVTAINREDKTVTAVVGATGEILTQAYDSLLISTGSTPIVPPLPGIDAPNVFTLWNIPDTDAVYNYISENSPKSAIVVGGGFIGIEMAENLVQRGMQVTMVEKADQVMAPFDKDMAVIIENHLREKGVILHLGKGLASIEDGGSTMKLDTGDVLSTEMIILSIGIRPNSKLAKDVNLEINPRGGIVTDEFMRTSDPSIYALGDVGEVIDFNTGDQTMVPLAGPANKQGRMIARAALGLEAESYTGTQGTSVAKIFELTAASTGLNEKTLSRGGKVYKEDYLVAILHPASHAGYYPGANQMTFKLIFDKSGKVLGAQIVGRKGVDKRIDVIATAMRFGASIYDLQKLELAYAPPYSSAKDPVNMAGFIAADLLEGLSDGYLVRELDTQDTPYTLIDLRETSERDVAKIDGSLHIPLTQLRKRMGELSKDTHYILHCAVGLRGYLGERILKANGFKVGNLLGGYKSYSNTHCIVENPTPVPPKSEKKKINSAETLNLCGQSCPGPIVAVAKALKDAKEGTQFHAIATDPGFGNDIKSWCSNTGNTLIEQYSQSGEYHAIIEKGILKCDIGSKPNSLCTKEKTMIVFSGELDKAIASFIIANGAAAMGNQVNMFFTFWGLNILRKPEKQAVKKDFMSGMFAAMMPRGSKKLGISKMNFGGAGAKMIRTVMQKKGVNSIEELIAQAIESGVKITACQMSMDIMGITKEELIDGVEIGGVATMLDDNDHSNMNLFI